MFLVCKIEILLNKWTRGQKLTKLNSCKQAFPKTFYQKQDFNVLHSQLYNNNNSRNKFGFWHSHVCFMKNFDAIKIKTNLLQVFLKKSCDHFLVIETSSLNGLT